MHLRDLTQFLAELSENNQRAWFVMNKPRYDILRAEFLELVTALIAAIARFDPLIADCNPKKALFRINRDMRFSQDKSPYKTTFSAAIIASGRKKPSEGGGPSYYFHIDAAGTLLVAAGEYMPPSDRLRAIRQQIVADPDGFAKVLKNRKLIARFNGLQEEGKLTRAPKGFEPDHRHVESLKLKNFIVWTERSIAGRYPPDNLCNEIAATFTDALALVKWLRAVPVVAHDE